jgi:hypothetical protein
MDDKIKNICEECKIKYCDNFDDFSNDDLNFMIVFCYNKIGTSICATEFKASYYLDIAKLIIKHRKFFFTKEIEKFFKKFCWCKINDIEISTGIFNIVSCDIYDYFRCGKKMTIDVVKLFVIYEPRFCLLLKNLDNEIIFNENIILFMLHEIYFYFNNKLVDTPYSDVYIEYFKDHKPSSEMLDLLLENGLFVVYLFVINKYDCVVTSNHLLICCKIVIKDYLYYCGATDCIKFILDRKIIPTSGHFKELFDEYTRYKNNELYICATGGDIGYLLNLFFECGYKPSLDDIKKMVKSNIVVQNFYKYDIIPDRELYDLCVRDEQFIIYDYFDNFELSQKDIEELFSRTNNIKIILSILKNHKCILNKKCLENAKKLRFNEEIINYLISEHGITD